LAVGWRWVRAADQLSRSCQGGWLRSEPAKACLRWDMDSQVERCYHCLKPALVVKEIEKGKQKGADIWL